MKRKALTDIADFQRDRGFLAVLKAIHNTHICILKPRPELLHTSEKVDISISSGCMRTQLQIH